MLQLNIVANSSNFLELDLLGIYLYTANSIKVVFPKA